MIEKSRGIVLNKIQYSDNKNIVKIYSEMGTNAYISLKSSKSKRNNALQPMSLIHFCAEKKKGNQMAWLKEIEYSSSFSQSDYQLPKVAVSMFLNDVLYKLLLNAGEDRHFFNFLYETLEIFYSSPFCPDFHLRFLLHCSKELGVCPIDNYQSDFIFNVESASFEPSIRQKQPTLQQIVALHLHNLLVQNIFPENKTEIVPIQARNALLDCLLQFYCLHIVDLSKIKSLDVLRTILHD